MCDHDYQHDPTAHRVSQGGGDHDYQHDPTAHRVSQGGGGAMTLHSRGACLLAIKRAVWPTHLPDCGWSGVGLGRPVVW